ncbi:uracil phosphoribosyltransferase [Colletotrichum limetticola]|uniref:Uracil phosphoribosyltransferase n=1 Tax=Colletotrichum limetticola TaxID=1209924 RepID=A0ABQ9PA29_9PEZI|nr:uracil phosphoribosyltransferase [Colletotrichum limetticola]
MHASAGAKPTIVGLYGVPGSGKSFLLRQLRAKLRDEHFQLYEGSEVIDNVVPGGLKAFKSSSQSEREIWRQRAIDFIAEECAGTGRLGIVSGHFSFWPEDQVFPEDVYTPADLNVYTHILYLDTPADVVARRCLEDSDRARSLAFVDRELLHVRLFRKPLAFILMKVYQFDQSPCP